MNLPATVLGLAMLSGLAGLASLSAAGPPSTLPAEDLPELRQALLKLLNGERARAGVPALRLSAPLTTAAQARAAEVADPHARADVGWEHSQERMSALLQRVDYRAERWTASVVTSGGTLPEVLRYWRSQAKGQQGLEPELKEVGIGIAPLSASQDLYCLLFAVRDKDAFETSTSDLHDLAAVRRQVLDRINAERRAHRAPPLTAEPRLDLAAQRHAEDMLKRGYFAHPSPEGETIVQRADAVSYTWSSIGENIAQGQPSVDDVVRGWMASPEHRENILNPDFRQMGLGLALGEGPHGFQVEWVQTFGHPRERRR